MTSGTVKKLWPKGTRVITDEIHGKGRRNRLGTVAGWSREAECVVVALDGVAHRRTFHVSLLTPVAALAQDAGGGGGC